MGGNKIKFKKICPKIWNDSRFMGMTNLGKLAFLYMLTHPNMNAIGGIRCTLHGIATELAGVGPEAFREAFAKGMAVESNEAPLLWLPNFLKYNQPESPNVVKAWVKSLYDLPSCTLKQSIISNAYRVCLAKGEAFAKAFKEAFDKDLPLSEAEAEANYFQIGGVVNHARAHVDPSDEFINPETGEVIYERN